MSHLPETRGPALQACSTCKPEYQQVKSLQKAEELSRGHLETGTMMAHLPFGLMVMLVIMLPIGLAMVAPQDWTVT